MRSMHLSFASQHFPSYVWYGIMDECINAVVSQLQRTLVIGYSIAAPANCNCRCCFMGHECERREEQGRERERERERERVQSNRQLRRSCNCGVQGSGDVLRGACETRGRNWRKISVEVALHL